MMACPDNSGKLPAFAEACVFAARQEDIDGMAVGPEPRDELAQVLLIHAGAAGGGGGAVPSPDMEED